MSGKQPPKEGTMRKGMAAFATVRNATFRQKKEKKADEDEGKKTVGSTPDLSRKGLAVDPWAAARTGSVPREEISISFDEPSPASAPPTPAPVSPDPHKNKKEQEKIKPSKSDTGTVNRKRASAANPKISKEDERSSTDAVVTAPVLNSPVEQQDAPPENELNRLFEQVMEELGTPKSTIEEMLKMPSGKKWQIVQSHTSHSKDTSNSPSSFIKLLESDQPLTKKEVEGLRIRLETEAYSWTHEFISLKGTGMIFDRLLTQMQTEVDNHEDLVVIEFISCLKVLLNSKSGLESVIKYPGALDVIVDTLDHIPDESKGRTLEILAALSLVSPSAHRSTLTAMKQPIDVSESKIWEPKSQMHGSFRADQNNQRIELRGYGWSGSITLQIQIPTLGENLYTMRFFDDELVSNVVSRFVEMAGISETNTYGLFLQTPSLLHLKPNKRLSQYPFRNALNKVIYKSVCRHQQVQMLDGTTKVVKLNESFVASEAMKSILKLTNPKLTNPEEYWFQVKETWVRDDKTLFDQYISEDQVLVIKRKFFISDGGDSDDALFDQIREAVVSGKQPVTIEEAVKLAAFCYLSLFGSQQTKASFVKEKIPEIIAEIWHKKNNIADQISKQISTLGSSSGENPKADFCKYAKTLKTYGATSFQIKEKKSPKDKKYSLSRVLALTNESIMILDASSNEIVSTIPLTQIKSWGAKSGLLAIDRGSYGDKLIVATDEGEAIANLIRGYAALIVKKRTGGAVGAGGAGGSGIKSSSSSDSLSTSKITKTEIEDETKVNPEDVEIFGEEVTGSISPPSLKTIPASYWVITPDVQEYLLEESAETIEKMSELVLKLYSANVTIGNSGGEPPSKKAFFNNSKILMDFFREILGAFQEPSELSKAGDRLRTVIKASLNVAQSGRKAARDCKDGRAIMNIVENLISICFLCLSLLRTASVFNVQSSFKDNKYTSLFSKEEQKPEQVTLPPLAQYLVDDTLQLIEATELSFQGVRFHGNSLSTNVLKELEAEREFCEIVDELSMAVEQSIRTMNEISNQIPEDASEKIQNTFFRELRLLKSRSRNFVETAYVLSTTISEMTCQRYLEEAAENLLQITERVVKSVSELKNEISVKKIQRDVLGISEVIERIADFFQSLEHMSGPVEESEQTHGKLRIHKLLEYMQTTRDDLKLSTMIFINALIRQCAEQTTRNDVRKLLGLGNIFKKLRQSSLQNPDLLFQLDLYEDLRESDEEEEDLKEKLRKDESQEFFEKLKQQIKQSNNSSVSETFVDVLQHLMFVRKEGKLASLQWILIDKFISAVASQSAIQLDPFALLQSVINHLHRDLTFSVGMLVQRLGLNKGIGGVYAIGGEASMPQIQMGLPTNLPPPPPAETGAGDGFLPAGNFPPPPGGGGGFPPLPPPGPGAGSGGFPPLPPPGPGAGSGGFPPLPPPGPGGPPLPPGEGGPPGPPPPPGMGGPPPPPPPPGMGGPPPPPPPPGMGGPPGPPPPPGMGGPPPPPGMGGPPGPPGAFGGMAKIPKKPVIKPKTKMKQFNWAKLNYNQTKQTVWSVATDDTIKLDSDEIEQIFGVVQIVKKEAPKEEKKPTIVSLLDMKRSNNVSIVLSRFRGTSPADIKENIMALDMNFLNVEAIEALRQTVPTAEEVEMIKGYDGDKNLLAPAEKFFMEVMDIPRMDQRLQAFGVKLTFDTNLDRVSSVIGLLSTLSKRIKESKSFVKLLEIILALGNYINGNTARGGAFGFKMDAMLKLGDTKGNNKANLLHYLCEYSEKNYPEVANIDQEFPELEEAVKFSVKQINTDLGELRIGLRTVEQEVKAMAETDPAIRKKLANWHPIAQQKFQEAEAAYGILQELSKELMAWIAYDQTKDLQDLFIDLKTFFNSFEKSKKENERRKVLAEKAAIAAAKKEEAERKKKELAEKKAAELAKKKAEQGDTDDKDKDTPQEEESGLEDLISNMKSGLAFA